ncbi:MAG: fibronectin type III domain-containing protein [Sphingomonadales bacterium]|nr:MAG: fibronectin type III domain-containing protein [Sphingomonadales bacterium]
MAKAIKTIGVVVGAVALVATGIGAVGVGLGMAASTAATFSAIGTYASIATGVIGVVSTLASKPKVSTAGSPQNFATDPQSGIPYCIGRTATSGVRIYADTNSRPGYTKFDDLLWFGVLLSGGGEIEEIEAFAADSDIVTFNASTGMAIGTYANYMAQKLWKGGAMASALALSFAGATAPGWTSEHKLSGMTHAQWCLRFNKEGDLYSAGVPEPKWIGKWVRVYDPRLDSTYPGGSGSCRALDESTYVWSRNPGLHALTWCLGRWQNGKKTLGIGAPVANIRIADFVECANICEANGWWCGGTEYSTDSKWDILKRMLQAGGAIPTMPGAMIGCRVNAPRISIASITGGDLLDTLKIPATKSRRDRFNAVIPRYRSESHEWEIISGSQITKSEFVAADGGIRLKEIDYPLVQAEYGIAGVDGDKQVGQLAAYDIANSREAGPISWTTGPKWLGLKTGDCVTLDVPEEGLSGQDVILTGVSRDPSTGKISFTAETETPEKHPWALGQSTTPPPAFSLTAPDLTPPTPDLADWTLAAGVSTDGLPYIRVAGGTDNPYADYAIVQYRINPDGDWLHYGQLAATSVDVTINGLDGGTDYAARIAYINGTTTGPWRELDAVTTPDNGLQILIANVQTTVDAKRTIFVQPTAPSAAESAENDWWQQTTADRSTVIATYRRVAGSGQLAIGGNRITIGGSPISLCWTPVEDQRIGDALIAATDAANLADSKAVVFTMYSAGEAEPIGTDIGDILVRAYLSPVQVDYWNGTSWAAAATYGATDAQAAQIIDALTDAANAQATADGKIETFYQTSAPTGASIGDLWFDTDDGNKLYRYSGTAWVLAQDAAIATAIAAAAGAQETADGKIDTFYQTSAPTGVSIGDLWFDTDDGNKLYRYSGSAWVLAQDAGIGAAITAAAGAQATADGKVRTFYQTSVPAATSVGDLWIDTDDGNKLYRYSGSAWVVVQDAGIGAAITAAAGAQATADGKVVTFVGESAPVAEGAGDLWYKSSTKTMSRWSGSAWVVVSAQNVADGATVGAPSGTNVGSTPATTVESGAQAGGNAANIDGTIKNDNVDTVAIIDNAITDRVTLTNSGTTFSTLLGPLVDVALSPSFTFTKHDNESILEIYTETELRSTNDIVAKTSASLQLISGGPVKYNESASAWAIASDGSTDTFVRDCRLFDVSDLPAGDYAFFFRAINMNGVSPYPSTAGTQSARPIMLKVQEIKK